MDNSSRRHAEQIKAAEEALRKIEESLKSAREAIAVVKKILGEDDSASTREIGRINTMDSSE